MNWFKTIHGHLQRTIQGTRTFFFVLYRLLGRMQNVIKNCCNKCNDKKNEILTENGIWIIQCRKKTIKSNDLKATKVAKIRVRRERQRKKKNVNNENSVFNFEKLKNFRIYFYLALIYFNESYECIHRICVQFIFHQNMAFILFLSTFFFF